MANKLAIVDGGTFETHSLSFLDTAAPLESLDWRSGGTLVINGGTVTGLDTLSVLDGRTLRGTGTIDGDLVVAGLLAPGSSPGIMTVDGDFTLEDTGTLSIEIDGTGTPGVDWDLLSVNGGVTLDGGSLEIVLGYEAAINDSFLIVDNDGSTDAILGQFATNGLDGFSVLAIYEGATYEFTIDYAGGDGNDIVLTATTGIPEPSTLGLLAVGSLALARRRRGTARRV